ncbi:hypothetical protein BSL78_19193 [Apostichopus japonicus]|uniref:Uncharacterized protein n=1 Tax=Stichopus japonicus TaxID=307972 RepID=A0A2G8K7H8_STIJA|nr:hypothetical protein BSL78_19193 [Apostichopus japonicus]
MSVMLVTNPKSQTQVTIYVSPSALLNVLIDSGLHLVDNRYGNTGMTDMLSGGYNTQGKVSPRNRKREKAHVKMRDRMRRKMYGSSVLQTRLQNPASNTSRSLPAITTIADQETVSPKKSLLNRDGYWRTQQERYDTMLHTGNPTIGGNRDNESIQSLMNRVMEKKRQTQPIQNNSLLTIRSYRRPTAPYAIQQQSLIKKMVGIAPSSRKAEKKGPYVLVLQTRKNSKSLKEPKNTKDLQPVVAPSDDKVSSEKTLSSPESKPEIKPLPQISKWKPNQ